MLYFKRLSLAVSDVTMKAELPAATKSTSKNHTNFIFEAH